MHQRNVHLIAAFREAIFRESPPVDAEIERLTKALHAAQKHPEFSYVVIPAWRDGDKKMLIDGGYERNHESDNLEHPGIDECWRRRKDAP